jgi:hypothetical protein
MTPEKRSGFIAIHQSFAETELGATLADRIRYEKYKPAEVSNERWEDLLGADVNNLAHMPLTYGLTRSMIRNLQDTQPGFLNDHEEEVLQVTALIHDQAEAIVGDINYNDKTPEDEVEEMHHLSAILDEHYEGDTSDIKHIILEAAEVMKSPDSKLGHVFNTIERIGYMRTALRAAEHVKRGAAPDCEEELRWMTADVLGNHTVTLMERADDYIPVRIYLGNQAHVIDEAFSIVTPEVFTNYPPEQRQSKELAHHSAYAAWRQWTT